MTVELNISRLQYLLDQYQLSEQEFLQIISKGLKKNVSREEIFNKQVKLNTLKRVDQIFNKGLAFYIDPQPAPHTSDASIFFRKSKFNSDLNLKAKKIVNEFEELKLSLSAIASLSDIDFRRSFPILTIKDNAKQAAIKFREIIKPRFLKGQKEFLQSLINKLALYNIMVFEFVETWNQKERANIDGVFLGPNVIVLKRQEGHSFKREIFTLLHEFAHYLLNIEEVEKLDYEILARQDLNDVEQWCNEFAFYFLIGEYEQLFSDLPYAEGSNDYNHEIIDTISANTHLSKMALFTRLLFNNKISYPDYKKEKEESDQKAKEYYEAIRRERELEKEKGNAVKGSNPKPIKSDLLISTIQTAFYEGVIDEYQVCKTLKIAPERIGVYIQ